jgi:hypothetical protein
MNKETGGSAFPVSDIQSACPATVDEMNRLARGMTLRDYFAGQAMDGYNKCIRDYGWGEEILFEHAKQAYAIADAMLKARVQ